MNTVKSFYNDLAQYYHLIYSNWDQSIDNQGQRISAVIKKHWGKTNNTVLDCTCGIGTQALGLARIGYSVTGSDLSDNAIKRARAEASKRKLKTGFSVADVRELWNHHQKTFDIVLSADNSLPHLLSDKEFKRGLAEMYRCTREGGGCVISVRDYEKDVSSGMHLLPYGVRMVKNHKYIVFQVREFYNKDHYNVNLYFVKDSGTATCKTLVFRSRYYAISIRRIMDLMEMVGFVNIKRIDDGFFQPIIVGTRPKNV
jgi:ubiquinone/menaquinone biosynthesis C-methylase UbiE